MNVIVGDMSGAGPRTGYCGNVLNDLIATNDAGINSRRAAPKIGHGVNIPPSASGLLKSSKLYQGKILPEYRRTYRHRNFRIYNIGMVGWIVWI